MRDIDLPYCMFSKSKILKIVLLSHACTCWNWQQNWQSTSGAAVRRKWPVCPPLFNSTRIIRSPSIIRFCTLQTLICLAFKSNIIVVNLRQIDCAENTRQNVPGIGQRLNPKNCKRKSQVDDSVLYMVVRFNQYFRP